MAAPFLASQVISAFLAVWEPTTYTGPSDVDQLGTMYFAYIPSDQVDTLANLIRAKQSVFYTSLPAPYSDLAAHVVPSFPVNAVSQSSGSDGGSSNPEPGSSADTVGSSSSSKTREDAIIGVVSSLGAITLIVLAFLVVRAIKQRRALAHHRLSDSQQDDMYVGARPDNQDFDRDSVGGARRRSFYYAEDSLRGAAGPPQGFVQSSEAGMRERRPVNAAMIGTPILRDNTMNW